MKIEIQKSLEVLIKNDVLLYPTDTVWGLGCDATSESAVAKIFNIKQRSESKSLIILVNDIDMLKQYIPNVSAEILRLLSASTNPTTIIYNNPVGLAKNIVASDNTVAVRIVQNEFCQQLIATFGKPIVSTSANVSGKATPKSFKEIEQAILHSVDYSVNLQREVINEKSSTILKVGEHGDVSVLRE